MIPGRGGQGGLIAQERLEVLWGARGPEREWALRRGELVDIQKLITDMRKSLDDLKKALTKVKEDVDALTIAVADLEDQMEGLETRIEDAEQSLDELEAVIAEIDGRLDGIDTSILALQSDVAALQSTVGSVAGDVTALQVDVSHLQTDLTALTARVTATELDITQLELDVNELELGLPSLTVTADLNTAVRNKEFQWSSTSTNIPVAGSFGRGFTMASSSNDLTQVGIINTTGQTFVRFRTGGTWGAWQDLISLRAEPYALQSNPGATPFPAGAYTAIPFFTSTELSGGITKTGNSTFTVLQAGLYQFELEVRANGGLAGLPILGTPLGLSMDTTTVPTSLRAGYCTAQTVTAMTIMRFTCTERLAAGAQRVPYIYNGGAAAYQVTTAVLKITRLSA